jgi:hypothetical protein
MVEDRHGNTHSLSNKVVEFNREVGGSCVGGLWQ